MPPIYTVPDVLLGVVLKNRGTWSSPVDGLATCCVEIIDHSDSRDVRDVMDMYESYVMFRLIGAGRSTSDVNAVLESCTVQIYELRGDAFS